MSNPRARWAAVGAAVAITLGAGGVGLVGASKSSGERAVFTAIEPCRLADTRPDFLVGDKATPWGPGEVFTVQATGSNGECSGIPSDAVAVGLNVTAVDPSMLTYLSFFPGGDVPNSSSLNPAPDQPPTPNAVTVDLAAGGSFDVFNLQGEVDVVIDVVGYYQDHDHDDRYPAKSQRVVVPADAFVPSSPATTVSRGTIDGTYVWAGPGTLKASLELPIGTVIDRVVYHYRDRSGAENLRLGLSRTDLTSASSLNAGATVTTDGISTEFASIELTDLGIEIEEGFGYALSASNSSWSTERDDLTVKGVEIEYVLP